MTAGWMDLMRRTNGQTVFLSLVVAVALGLVAYLALFREGTETPQDVELTLAAIPFDGQRAFGVLEELCSFGPRPCGSPGMLKQRQFLREHFTRLGGRVREQKFDIRHPETGEAVELVNLIVEFHPEKRERVLFCAHYDTRPFPDEDKVQPRGIFLGANDGASGVAVLAELARGLPGYRGKYGVDLLLVDGEEFIFDKVRDRALFFQGSEYFAGDYLTHPPAHRYVWGILLDMVGDRDLQIYQEKQSVSWPETKPLVDSLWETARKLGVREFVARPRHEVNDDHLALRNIAGIPTCDVIDFDYGRNGLGDNSYWHTTQDIPANCSALSLAKVGWVMQAWLESVK